jgi:hypothetical protein
LHRHQGDNQHHEDELSGINPATIQNADMSSRYGKTVFSRTIQ